MGKFGKHCIHYLPSWTITININDSEKTARTKKEAQQNFVNFVKPNISQMDHIILSSYNTFP